jgi:hypothetical protein
LIRPCDSYCASGPFKQIQHQPARGLFRRVGAHAAHLFGGVVFLCIFNTAYSAEKPIDCADPRQSTGSIFTCVLAKSPKDSTITLGARVGQDTGEAYLSLLVPLYTRGQSLLFLNPRGVLKDEGNIGLGFRHMFGDNKVIVGANFYRD